MNSTLEQTRFLKLHQVVKDSPEIGAMVQEYILQYTDTYLGVNPLASAFHFLLPNLRYLTVQTSFISHQGPLGKIYLDPSTLGSLVELSLDVASIIFAEVAGYMYLPKLRSFKLKGRIHRHLYKVQGIPESYKSKCSSLRNLKFGWFMDEFTTDESQLQSYYIRLLELPHSLERLSIKLCIKQPDKHMRTAWSTMAVFPSLISDCLLPLNDSLKELEIIALGGTSFKSDGTTLDLSAFGELSKVTISSILVVPSESNQSDVRVYQLIPTKLKELEIRFRGCSYIRKHPMRSPATGVLVDHSDWLTEITKHKNVTFLTWRE